MMRHLHLLEITDLARCRWCEEEEETTSHLLCECPAVMRTRNRHLGSAFLEPMEIRDLPVLDLISFSKDIGFYG
jgi:hypothetical protein